MTRRSEPREKGEGIEGTRTNFDPDAFHLLKNQLEKGGSIGVRLISGSMAPFLPVGTFAKVQFCRFEDIQRFDIIVYWRNDCFVCHAVWDIGYLPAANGERTLITRGISNPEFDYPVAESEIFGRVMSHRLTAWQCLRMSFLARFRFKKET